MYYKTDILTQARLLEQLRRAREIYLKEQKVVDRKTKPC